MVEDSKTGVGDNAKPLTPPPKAKPKTAAIAPAEQVPFMAECRNAKQQIEHVFQVIFAHPCFGCLFIDPQDEL